MGPNALFDKSFLQSLSVDESVWFDHYFSAVICPLFYVETLADLEKAVREGRAPEDEVGIIAGKFPEVSGMPCVYHAAAAIANLLGHEVPMTGQIPVPGGRKSRADGRTGVIFERSPESEAFDRWRRREFLALERDIAKSWRAALTRVDLDTAAKALRRADGKPIAACQSIGEARAVAADLFTQPGNRGAAIGFVIEALQIPRQFHTEIMRRWGADGYCSLHQLAPYASYVATVESFFALGLAAGLIGTSRASNRVDIAYLHYLPFCSVFISSDKLHRRCAATFMRPDQQFVWGPDLKRDLQALNGHFLALPEELRSRGLPAFAGGPPPREVAPLLADVWKSQHWGNPRGTSVPLERIPPEKLKQLSQTIVEDVERFEKANALGPGDSQPALSEFDSVTVKRSFRKRKGSWYQMPKDLPPPK